MKKEHIYKSLSDVAGRHLGILQHGDNVSNTQHTVRKNTVNVDLEFLFLLHVND